jgi:hypothetical protein
MDAMDFQPTQNITATQAIGDENGDPELDNHPMPPPLNPEHAAIRADFEIITATMMEQLYNKITADITRSVAATFEKTTGQLNRQISLLNGRITQMQQQLLEIQKPIQPPPTAPVQASVKKILRTTMEKKNAGEGSTRTTTTTAATAPVTASPAAMQSPATNARGWETVKSGGQPKQKKTTPPKLITTS